jgi:hypothetical protein
MPSLSAPFGPDLGTPWTQPALRSFLSISKFAMLGSVVESWNLPVHKTTLPLSEDVEKKERKDNSLWVITP